MALENPLLSLLATNPHPLLQPTSEYNAAALSLAKLYLDPLAQSISDIQTQRQKENRKKRKRGTKEDIDERPLQLKRLHVDGFKVDQVHEQVRRVLDAAAKEIRLGLKNLPSSGGVAIDEANSKKRVHFKDENLEYDEDLLEDGGFHTDENSDSEGDNESSDEDVDMLEEDGDDNNDDESDGEDIETVSSEEDDSEASLGSDDESAEEFVEDKFGLNDGFFSIDDFNRQSEFLEQADLNNQDDGAASDEEDVDWSADPFATNLSKPGKARDLDEGEDEDEDDDDGPTFGDMDLDAPQGFSENEDDNLEDAVDVDMDRADDLSNANNIMYKDFFKPPARKGGEKRKGKNGNSKKHDSQAKSTSEDMEVDISRTMAAVHRDLFSDEEDVDDDDDLSEVDEFDPKSRRSNHERRQAKLLQEIRRLEAENVAKREWTMSGEARAVDRPQNSLLEEDLEFERAGKPVPVVTQEVSEDIEALIKRRILARDFDEVLRRRPDELLTGPLGRRGRIEEELQDTKSKKGLAELYEEEHLRRTDPNYVDGRTEQLKASHREIENLWKDIVDKLDSLSSWHYRPKPVEVNIQVRTDAPTISMEDARPSGVGGDVAVTSQLAPQEVYKAGQDRGKDEIVTKGGEVIARDEMSREEKKSRRARQKERAKKASKNQPVAAANGKTADGGSKKAKSKKEKNELVGDLKKAGVMVIGRKGELVDVEGKEVKGKKALGAGALKL
ncbi:uncharacterized protein PV09_03756 [Verruconis gallopava]|uniref:U3 small nucleolar ribonucleoprotein protein MPP10 n=1 Tax=Verruconis gallopava TaxID=253628 RepID=A0A0D2AE02_9PEZI|nr:uncharacterized protein PV09_03756 [Verruconis gallopava]KIW05213.1 hypothetical protein PV09_03756 [Verruconis gallopava]